MFLQVLRPFETFLASAALVRLQGDMDTDMGCNMVALDRGCSTQIPATGEVEVVGALATNMSLTDMILQNMSAGCDTQDACDF
jgi:hypothetical protein